MAEHSIALKDVLLYRYLMDIDGHTTATPRNALWLHSNSVTFKQVTENVQWYYRALTPYEHFIPVAENLSDIFSRIAWAKDNDEKCKKMVHPGNRYLDIEDAR